MMSSRVAWVCGVLKETPKAVYPRQAPEFTRFPADLGLFCRGHGGRRTGGRFRFERPKNDLRLGLYRRDFLARVRDAVTEFRESLGHARSYFRILDGVEKAAKVFDPSRRTLDAKRFVFRAENGELMRFESANRIVGRRSESPDSERSESEREYDHYKP